MVEKKDSNKIWTIKELLRTSYQYALDKTNQNLKLDIELLLAKVLKCSRVELYTNYMVPVSSKELEEFRSLLKKRLMDVPLSYILGYKEFWKSSFIVNENTLIPRSDSEFIVEKANEYCRKILNQNNLSILDIGTGSGCLIISIALSLKEILDKEKQKEKQKENLKDTEKEDIKEKKSFDTTTVDSQEYCYIKISDTDTTDSILNKDIDINKDKEIIENKEDLLSKENKINVDINTYYEAWDISEKALEVAKQNSDTILDKNYINFIEKDVLNPNILKDYSRRFDIIVSNPPYIEPGSKDLDIKSTKFEPKIALFAEDFIFYRRIAEISHDLLNTNGIIILEIGIGQKDKVIEIFKDKNFHFIECVKDYSGIDRVLIFS